MKCNGKSFIIKRRKITQAKLAKELKISEGNLSDLLSFNDISDKIWESIEDVSKVSVRAALHIRKIIEEDDSNIEKLLKISVQLRKGIGRKKIDEILQRNVNFKEENTIRDLHNNKIITIKNREIKFHEHFGVNHIVCVFNNFLQLNHILYLHIKFQIDLKPEANF